MDRNQARDAQHLYDQRGPSYDNSCHPRFARHLIELADPQPGEQVLDLACGTGLATFLASPAVGTSGKVIGVDISSGMLAEAQRKKEHNLRNVEFYQHSITDLATLEAIEGKTFDVITCISALVLLKDPAEALQQWTRYLKPGGRLITDATHPKSQLAHITLERVGESLGVSVPSYRLPFQRPQDLQTMMEGAGLGEVNVKVLSQFDREDGRQDLAAFICDPSNPVIDNRYTIGDASARFASIIGTRFGEVLAGDDYRSRAYELFKLEWARLAQAEDGLVEIDGIYVGMGKRL